MGIVCSGSNLFCEILLVLLTALFTCQRNINTVLYFNDIHARYELRNPKSHLPAIKHKYAENSIRYCLIRQLNSEVTWASTVEIKNMVFTTPYPRFKTSIKNKIIDSYKEHCVKRTEDCFVCTRLRLF